MVNYNKGQEYEEKIKELLIQRQLLPDDLNGNDAGFFHKGEIYYLEVKNEVAPDYGQRRLVWSSESGWKWSKVDHVSEMLDDFGAMNFIDKNFQPRRYSIPKNKITVVDKTYDQQQIKISGIVLDSNKYLYEYYAKKECYYIQIEGKGFYYLQRDVANLGVPQFAPKLTLRLRAKTHSTNPTYNYSFFAVINANPKKVAGSRFDIEEIVGVFPSIVN